MIPKIVHLTYKSLDSVPAKWKPSIEAWKSFGWDVRFYSDKDNLQLVANDYPQLLHTYTHYKIPIQRVDAVRICYLHKYGGVYCDLDLVPTEDLYHYFEKYDLVLLRSPNFKTSLTNMLMASSAGHSFWLEYMNALNRPNIPWWAFTRHFYVMYSTGPMLLDKVSKETKSEYTLLPTTILPCSICEANSCNRGELKLIEGMSWNASDSHVINFFLCHSNWYITSFLLVLLFLLHLLLNKLFN